MKKGRYVCVCVCVCQEKFYNSNTKTCLQTKYDQQDNQRLTDSVSQADHSGFFTFKSTEWQLSKMFV